MNEELLENDPVLTAIRAEMERMLADSSFKPGPPKKKAHKVEALAPLIRSLRAQGRTWPAIAETCKNKGLVVTAKTVREVMRELDGPSQRSETIRVAQISATSKTTKAGTAQRKSGATAKRKSGGKSSGKPQRTSRANADNATGEIRAHTNGRENGTARNVDAEPGAPLASNDGTEGGVVANRVGDSRETAAAAQSAASPASSNLPTPAASTSRSKRRFGAKGIEY